MLKVRVQNFQSFVDQTITIDGFTVVSGSNNSGKTALMRAIRGVFTNPSPGALVRNGSKFCSVEITFPNNSTVLWEKGTGVNRYTLNGDQVFDNVGRGTVPEEVQALGIKFLQVAGEKILPQIASQWSGQVFLLDKSGSFLAEAISDTERIGRLNASLKSAESERRSVNSKLKVRYDDLRDLNSSLERFEGVDQLLAILEEVEEAEKTKSKVEKAISIVQEFDRNFEIQQGIIRRLSWISECPLESLSGDLISKYKEIREVESLISRWEKFCAEESFLQPLECVQKTLPDLTEVLSSLEKVERAKDFVMSLLKKISRVDKEISSAKSQIERERKELSFLESQIETCPTCGQLVCADD